MKKYFIVIIFGLLALSAGFFAIKVARAAFPGEGLTISPPVSEPKIRPGESAIQTVRLTNPTEKTIEVYPRTMDFKAKGETGEPEFYTATADSDKFSLSKWITYNPAKIALTPEQVVEYKYTLTVPSDAESGGHYGAIFFVSEPPKDQKAGTKVAIGSMVGSLVLLTVPGESIEKGIVDSFVTNLKLYLTGNTVNFETKISNVGNVHFKPKGNIKVKSAFGKEMGVITFNEQGGNVLPDSSRKFENKWDYKWYEVGYFKANLSVVYGISEKPLAASTGFWVIPVWLIVVVSVIILLLTIIIVWLKKRKGPKKSKDKPAQTPPPVAPQPPASNTPILR